MRPPALYSSAFFYEILVACHADVVDWSAAIHVRHLEPDSIIVILDATTVYHIRVEYQNPDWIIVQDDSTLKPLSHSP